MLWSTLFKLIPWGQVIDHAPQVLDGAKKLYQRLKSEGQAEDVAEMAVLPPEPEALAQAVRKQRHALARLHEEVEESGQLIKRLAEQHAGMVAEMESLAAAGLAGRVACRRLSLYRVSPASCISRAWAGYNERLTLVRVLPYS